MTPKQKRIVGTLLAACGLMWFGLCFWIPPLMVVYSRLYPPEFVFQALLRIEFVAAIFMTATGVLLFRSARHTLPTRSVVITWGVAIITSATVVALFWPSHR